MITSYLKDSVTIRKRSADSYGTRQTTETISAKAFIEYKRKLAGVQDGQQLMSEASVLILDCGLTLNDTIEFEGRQWRILKITKQRDFTVRYLEVLVA